MLAQPTRTPPDKRVGNWCGEWLEKDAFSNSILKPGWEGVPNGQYCARTPREAMATEGEGR
jgi:hypothetical protein